MKSDIWKKKQETVYIFILEKIGRKTKIENEKKLG